MVKKRQVINWVWYYLPPVLWMGVIFIFSQRTSIQTVDRYWVDFIIKKTAHLVEYAILAVLVYRALFKYGLKPARAFRLAMVYAVLFALTDEYHQSFIPGRDARMRDVLIDSLGVVIGLRLLLFLTKRFKRISMVAL